VNDDGLNAWVWSEALAVDALPAEPVVPLTALGVVEPSEGVPCVWSE